MVVLVAISASAQIKFGVHGGVIASQVAIKDTNSFIMAVLGDKKYQVGFKAGAFVEVPVTEKIYFNPAINFVRKGGNFKSKFFDKNIETRYYTNYIELPLNISLKASNAGGMYGGVGPSVGLGLSGKEIREVRLDNGTEEPKINNTIKFDGKTWMEAGFKDSHLKALELGMNVFIGYELQNGIRAQLNYRKNFSNLSPIPETTSYKNSYLGLTIGCAL